MDGSIRSALRALLLTPLRKQSCGMVWDKASSSLTWALLLWFISTDGRILWWHVLDIYYQIF